MTWREWIIVAICLIPVLADILSRRIVDQLADRIRQRLEVVSYWEYEVDP